VAVVGTVVSANVVGVLVLSKHHTNTIHTSKSDSPVLSNKKSS